MNEPPLIAPAPLRGELRLDEPMARHVSWRAGGRARVFFQPADLDDLAAFLASRPAGEARCSSWAWAATCSCATAASTARWSSRTTRSPASSAAGARGPGHGDAGAGVPLPHVARFVARRQGAGAEWMAGVPGTVGGGLAMNAGCYGGETWNHVVSVRTIDAAGRLRTRLPGDYEIGYRHAALRAPSDEWFVSGTFAFAPGEEAATFAAMKAPC